MRPVRLSPPPSGSGPAARATASIKTAAAPYSVSMFAIVSRVLWWPARLIS